MLHPVPYSDDIRRVEEIPRRVWTPSEAVELARGMTGTLRTDRHGAAWLRPIQAVALYEIATQPGLVAPIRVGGGKTLITALAPTVTRAERPLLLVPAHLNTPARRAEIGDLREYWQIPAHIPTESYQRLSTVGAADLLEQYESDLIIADECHYLKNPKAAATRRVRRYLDRVGPACRFVGLSGTYLGRGPRDYAHLMVWALHRGAPAPLHWRAVEDWHRAMDPRDRMPLAPGHLERLGPMRERITQTPGVVATREGPLPIRLEVGAIEIEPPPVVRDALRHLRGTWETPDGHPISDAVAMWRHAQELALGFYLRWNPRPPDWWLEPRREWARACREILSSNRRCIDTELQLIHAIDLYPHARPALEAWRAVRDLYEPQTEAVWLADHAVDRIREWMEEAPGIVWTAHRAIGARFGDRYYGALGRNARGEEIEHADTGRSIVASVQANATGRNLQRWSRNLVASCPPTGTVWEQLLGRTHRDGQREPVVTADVLIAGDEAREGFWRAVEWAGVSEELTGQAHKLTHAVIDVPEGA